MRENKRKMKIFAESLGEVKSFFSYLQRQGDKYVDIFVLEKYLMNNTLLSKLLLLLKVKHTKYSDKLYFEHPYKYTFYGLERMFYDKIVVCIC